MVAPATAAVEKFCALETQAVVLPEMETGCGGIVEIVIASVLGLPVPQPFMAATDIFPLAVVVTAVIELLVEVPDHPTGRVHI